ncbi:hypothetical protein JCM6882_006676 [Rhodosporidiobolus microsporus]
MAAPSLLSPPPATATTTSHSRTASELELASLDMNSLCLTSTSSSSASGGASRIDDADLLDSLPSLGQSVVEEAEGAYLGLALSALAFAATPAPSPSPSLSAGAASPSRSPSGRTRRPSPDYSDPSYFALSRRNLYASPESSWSSAASSVYSVSSTPSLCDSAASSYTADSLTNTPERSPAVEQEAYFSTACFRGGESPTISFTTPFSSASAPPTAVKAGIASRRPGASPTLLKLDLPPTSPADSFPSLRPSKSFSFAPRSPAPGSNPSSSSAASSPAPARKERPRWRLDLEEVAGVSSLVAAAAVEQVNLSRSRERSRRCSGGKDEAGSPPMFRRKGSYQYAF